MHLKRIGILGAICACAGMLLGGCTQAPHTVLTLDQATGTASLDTTVDRSLEGFHAIVTRSLDINGNPVVTSDIKLDKSQSSASAVVQANVELEKVRAEALGNAIKTGIEAGINAAKKAVIPVGVNEDTSDENVVKTSAVDRPKKRPKMHRQKAALAGG